MSVVRQQRQAARDARTCREGDHRECERYGSHRDGATKRRAELAARQARAFESYRLPPLSATVEQLRTYGVDELRESYVIALGVRRDCDLAPKHVDELDAFLRRIVEAGTRR